MIDEGHELELYDEHVVVEFERHLRGMERPTYAVRGLAVSQGSKS